MEFLRLKYYLGLKKPMLNGLILIISLLVVAAVFYFLQIKTQRDWDKIVESGRIRAISLGTSEGFFISKDSVYGFQYEMIKAFADENKLELEIAVGDNVRMNIDKLENNEFDIMANMIPVNSDYQDKVLFTTALQEDVQFLVQHVDSTSDILTRQYQLGGDTIWLSRNAPVRKLIESLSEQIADTIYLVELKNSTNEDAIQLVAEKKIKFTTCPGRLVQKMLMKYPKLNISMPLGVKQEYSWAVNANASVLRDKLSEFIRDFTGSDAYWKIYNKYYK
ncbi:MAG: transporter substrate-binding domain-containing protein [Paludibacter sp.]